MKQLPTTLCWLASFGLGLAAAVPRPVPEVNEILKSNITTNGMVEPYVYFERDLDPKRAATPDATVTVLRYG
jgi:hypothetical protein